MSSTKPCGCKKKLLIVLLILFLSFFLIPAVVAAWPSEEVPVAGQSATLATVAPTHTPTEIPTPTPTTNPKNMLVLVNQQRANNNVAIVEWDNRLAESARKKACDMLNKNYWAHFGPNGESPWTFILAEGYNYQYAGENLARDWRSDEEAMWGLMQSESHKANILNPVYADLGVGKCGNIMVQHFGIEY